MPEIDEDWDFPAGCPGGTDPRRRARILALAALCEADAQPDLSEDDQARALAEREPDPAVVERAVALVRLVRRDRESIDRRIADAATDWQPQRMGTVERNILRIGVAELLAAQTSPAVVLNEAVELARTFGGRDSPGFVNGVLDGVRRRLEGSGP